jgi:hypothetical protein
VRTSVRSGRSSADCRGRRGDDNRPGHARQKIAAKLYAALERLRADDELLAIVGNMQDTLTDKEVLRLLEKYNRSGKVIRQPE